MGLKICLEIRISRTKRGYVKIGIFTECYKPTINGVVSSIETFRTQLEEKGHEVFIFAPRHKQAKPMPNVFRVPSITLPSPKDYPIGIPYLTNLHPLISRLNLDIVHTQHIFLMGGFGQNVARKLNIPTVHTYHTMMTEYSHYVPIKMLQGLVKEFIIIRSKRFCNRANRVIVPSHAVAEVLKSYGVKTQIEVLPTGIDLKQFKKLNLAERQRLLTKYHIPVKRKILLFVGRLAQEKNLGFLLESFKDIVEKEPNVHLVLVGSGPDEENLKSQSSKLKTEDNVTFTGFLQKPEANKFFGAADIFVFPSTTDTQGIVLAEAMASSTPVVAINKLGPKDFVNNNKDGFLVNLTKNEFVDKILRLLENEKLRRKFGQNARENAKRLSIENCTKKLIEIYHDTKNSYYSQQTT